MKKKDFLKEIAGLDKDALKAKVLELRHEGVNLRIRRAAGQLENSARLADNRKEIARVETRIAQLCKENEGTEQQQA